LDGLAVCAGMGVGRAVEELQRGRWMMAAPVALAGIAYLVALPRLVHDDRHALYAGPSPHALLLAGYVSRHSVPTAFVAADDLAVDDLANRLVPPPLCDPSNVRLRAGYLTAADLIAATQTYRPQLVLSSFGIYAQVRSYLQWLQRHYHAVRSPPGTRAFRR
jgi:hypothetical protein